jgi:hypothetical protein
MRRVAAALLVTVMSVGFVGITSGPASADFTWRVPAGSSR